MKYLYILIAVACLAGCSSPETPKIETNAEHISDMQTRIEKAGLDPERAEAAQNILTKLNQQLTMHEANISSSIMQANATGYSTTREDLMDLCPKEKLAIANDLKAAHLAIKELTTPEEWAIISGGKKQLIELNVE